MWGVTYVMGGCNVVVILSMADMVIFLCRNCAVYELDLYNICLSNLCCKILLLLNMADMDCCLCKKL